MENTELPGQVDTTDEPPHTWSQISALEGALPARTHKAMQPGHYPDHRVPADAIFIPYDPTNITHCRIGSKGFPVSVCMDMPSKDWRTYDMDVSAVHPFYQMMLDRSFAKFAGKPGSHILHQHCAILPQQSEFWVRGPSTCIFHPLDFIRSFQYEWDNGLITSTIQAELREAFGKYKPKVIKVEKAKDPNNAYYAWIQACQDRKAAIDTATKEWHDAVKARDTVVIPYDAAVKAARDEVARAKALPPPVRPVGA